MQPAARSNQCAGARRPLRLAPPLTASCTPARSLLPSSFRTTARWVVECTAPTQSPPFGLPTCRTCLCEPSVWSAPSCTYASLTASPQVAPLHAIRRCLPDMSCPLHSCLCSLQPCEASNRQPHPASASSLCLQHRVQAPRNPALRSWPALPSKGLLLPCSPCPAPSGPSLLCSFAVPPCSALSRAVYIRGGGMHPLNPGRGQRAAAGAAPAGRYSLTSELTAGGLSVRSGRSGLSSWCAPGC